MMEGDLKATNQHTKGGLDILRILVYVFSEVKLIV